jgi:hypothetical protein
VGRLASLVIVVVSLALSSCGGEDGDGDGSKTGPTPSADKTPLERRDAPPAGVAEQVSYFAAGNGGCPESDYPAVRFNYGFPRENQAPIGQIGFTICMRGFAKERSVRVKVRRPDGREVVRRVEFDRAYGLHPLSWVPLPGDPLGRHDVTADQGATTANASFYVRRAPAPRVFALESPVPPGRPVPIILAGFEAGQRVRLHLYRLNKGEDGQFSYLTSITVRTDNRGELLHPLATDEDAVRATYLVRLNEQVQDSFDLQKPPPGSR